MGKDLIRNVLILGFLAVSGIIFIQSYWVIKTWDNQDRDFDLSVRSALRETAEKLADYNDHDLPKLNLINRVSSNYYVVNFNDTINPSVLEDYLTTTFIGKSINSDLEYGVYNCNSQELVYGKYCKLSSSDDFVTNRSVQLPSMPGLIYYFVVSFPNRESYLLSNMSTSIVFSVIAILAVLFFLYSMWVILNQKRLSELQRDFINNMTHEFKTPISSIKIATERLQSHDFIQNDPKLKQYSNLIAEQNIRLNHQVEKVLNIAKIEKNIDALSISTIDLNALLTRIVENERLRIKDVADATIELNLPTNKVYLEADEVHLSNTIYSIIDNSIKYSDKDIFVQINLNMTPDAHLEIIDKGIGLAKEDITHVFDKFYRVSTGNLHNVKGFGLGLFYVKKIAEAHDWSIDIDSELGKGTKISIHFKNYKERGN